MSNPKRPEIDPEEHPAVIIQRLVNEIEHLNGRLQAFRSGIWVRATCHHEDKDHNAEYHDDEYTHPFTVEAFTEDPGEYTHSGGSPDQFRVRVMIHE